MDGRPNRRNKFLWPSVNAALVVVIVVVVVVVVVFFCFLLAVTFLFLKYCDFLVRNRC